MSRRPSADSRMATTDLAAASTPPAQLFSAGFGKSGAAGYAADGNGQNSGGTSSGQNSRRIEEEAKETVPRSAGPSSAGGSPAVGQLRNGNTDRMENQTNNAATHLSGLMCNVHRTTGREPHPLVGATTTILGDKLYVFGGRILSRTRPQLTADLYELDLITRHWTKLETSGDVPQPRYFHSVCPLGDTKLVCYGGMSPAAPGTGQGASAAAQGQDGQPEVVVMSDIHIYDAPTRTWTYVPTQVCPEGRYAHCATILASTATFSSPNAPLSAIHHNPSSGNPNQGSIGVNIDGTGGAEMIVVGGQDSFNHYIEQISVFNLRSLKWTSTQQLPKSCGAYRTIVAPLTGKMAAQVGRVDANGPTASETKDAGSAMLVYSNYNFLDVQLDLQMRTSDGVLKDLSMNGSFSPPGLRFPNGGVIDTNFVVSGTYLTSSKQEYALWALDLKTLTWSRIDAGGNVFGQGSWNRGVLWSRKNTFVILGNRKRNLIDDYNHRRINFTNVCMVELEAFGLYDNPRRAAPMSGFVSASSPFSGPSLSVSIKAGWCGGGRSHSLAAKELGQAFMGLRELADMDILSVGGERIPVNSRLVARRWGPYFIQLLREGAATQEGHESTSQSSGLSANPSRNSSITITPSIATQSSMLSTATTLASSNLAASNALPEARSMIPTSRPRTLYLPQTHLTLQALLHYLYTSSLPDPSSPLSNTQILCSLLQIARPYRVDGLLEAVVERLHAILEGRNAAAVFNATAMAAGGGRAVQGTAGWGVGTANGGAFGSAGVYGDNAPYKSQPLQRNGSDLAARTQQQLRINTSVGGVRPQPAMRTGQGGSSAQSGSEREDDESSVGSATDSEFAASEGSSAVLGGARREIWRGDVSSVIGLQKRGLRGLMEGRRLRERMGMGAGGEDGRAATGVGG